jgi:hypothetical protein
MMRPLGLDDLLMFVYSFSSPLRGSVYLFMEIDDLMMGPLGLDDLLSLFIRLVRHCVALFICLWKLMI